MFLFVTEETEFRNTQGKSEHTGVWTILSCALNQNEILISLSLFGSQESKSWTFKIKQLTRLYEPL